jgi:hypothetical protein
MNRNSFIHLQTVDALQRNIFCYSLLLSNQNSENRNRLRRELKDEQQQLTLRSSVVSAVFSVTFYFASALKVRQDRHQRGAWSFGQRVKHLNTPFITSHQLEPASKIERGERGRNFMLRKKN